MPEDQVAPTMPTVPTLSAVPTLPPRDVYRPPKAYQAPSTPSKQPPIAPVPPPKRRGHRGLWSLLIAAAFAGGAFLVFGTDDEPNVPAADPAAFGADVETPPPAPGVGATQTTDGLEVTLVQSADPWISAYDVEQAAEGRRMVAVELSVVNTNAEAETLLAQTMVKLVYGDDETANYAFAGMDLTPFDGPVDPGDARQGWIVFELPADAADLVLEVRGSVLAPPISFAL